MRELKSRYVYTVVYGPGEEDICHSGTIAKAIEKLEQYRIACDEFDPYVCVYQKGDDGVYTLKKNNDICCNVVMNVQQNVCNVCNVCTACNA
jgi:hypothetical protein